MQTAKHLLFVTNGPQQQVNALILARKLALVATQHGYKHSVISLDEFESSDHFDHVIIIGPVSYTHLRAHETANM
ncbi:hypothetical protein ACN6Q1_10815, partial [Acinetobacter baumannii]